jgi:hypothetical protein
LTSTNFVEGAVDARDLLCFIYENIAKVAEAVYSNVVGAIGDSLAIFAPPEEKG